MAIYIRDMPREERLSVRDRDGADRVENRMWLVKLQVSRPVKGLLHPGPCVRVAGTVAGATT